MAYGIGNKPNMAIINNTETYNTSQRYIQTSTSDIITELNSYGRTFEPVGFSASNVRKMEKLNKQKHMIMLQAEDSELLDGRHMRLVLFNSSDRSTSIRLYFGVYSDACANDCVFGEDFMEPIMIKHTKQEWKHSIKSLIDEYENSQLKTKEMIERMLSRVMTGGDQYRFVHRAVNEIVNPIIEGEIIDPMSYNVAQRVSDTPKDLWHTYQRFQEHLVNGGVNRVIKKQDPDNPDRLFDSISKTHKITDPQKLIKANQQLHSMVMEYV